MTIPFHQFQRYKMVDFLFEAVLPNNRISTILEVGANEHKNLEKFVKGVNIKYLDLNLPDKLLSDPAFIKGDATDLKFNDNEFDFIIGLDVLEHIPPSKRVSFLNEIERVSKYGFLISAPFSGKGIEQSEKRIGALFKHLYDNEVLWSKEHSENGLPSLNFIKDHLSNFSGEYLFFEHGSLLLFERLMQMEYLAGQSETLMQYWETVNDYYNQNLIMKDFNAEPSVRTFFVYFKPSYISNLRRIENLLKERSSDLNSIDYSFINLFEKTIFYMANEAKSISTLIGSQLNKTSINSYFLQVFWDIGDEVGFSEKNSTTYLLDVDREYKEKENKYSRIFNAEIQIPSPVIKLRIDPITTTCNINVIDCLVEDQEGKLITNYELTSNASITLGNNYLFFASDPQIILGFDQITTVKKLKLKILFYDFDFNISESIKAFIQDNIVRISEFTDTEKRLRESNSTLMEQYNELVEKYNDVQSKISEITNSHSSVSKENVLLLEANESLRGELKVAENKVIEYENRTIEQEGNLKLLIGQLEEIKKSKTYKLSSIVNSFLAKIRRINGE